MELKVKRNRKNQQNRKLGRENGQCEKFRQLDTHYIKF